MRNAHKIIVELKKKHVAELYKYSICVKDNKCKLCLEDRPGRRHTGSVDCGHFRNRNGRVSDKFHIFILYTFL